MDNRPGGSQDLGEPSSYLAQQQHYDSSHLLLTADDDTNDTDTDSRDAEDEKPSGYLREQDRFLPIANIARIMKKSIPKTGKVAKESRECVQECVSEFVSFITSEASERCHQEKRKTINGEDILFAMQSLGFDNYVEPLKLYLQKYREANRTEKGILGTSIASGSGGESPNATTVGGVEPSTANVQIQSQPQTQTVVFAYDLGGQTHLQVQPATSAGGANFTIG